MAAEARLVDRGGGPPPVATLEDEQRHVLEAFAQATLIDRRSITVPPGGVLRLSRPLPQALGDATRVVWSARVLVDGRWRTLPSGLAPVRPRRGRPGIDLVLELPAAPAGAPAVLHVELRVPPAASRTRFDTPPVEIREGSRLEFGLGVLAPAWGEGPVRFRVSACRAGSCQRLFEETLDPATPQGRRWQDRRLALGERLRGPRSLRFETEAEGRFSLPVWSDPTVWAPRPRRAEDWNLLLISLDTLRADHLSLYGYPLDTAPFLRETFDREGTVFEASVAAATTTRPAHASLMSSLPPSVHGVVGTHARLPAAAVTLAEALRASGFATAAATENATLDLRNGLGRGFDRYREDKRREERAAEGHVRDTLVRGVDWMRRLRDRRFFLFLHTYQTHDPYTPPDRYSELFAEPAPGFEPHPALPPERAPALYDREIRYVDDELRRLFGALDELGLAECTVVVVTSDHGEEFLEHGGIGHGPHLHGEVLNVPLLLRGPGVPRGLRVAEPVSQLDLMPTLLDLAGVPRPASVMGRSLLPLLGPAAGAEPRPVFSETRVPGRAEPDVAVRLGARKLIRQHGADGLRHLYFDLGDDPGEARDRFAGAGEPARALQELLDAHLAETTRRRAALLQVGSPADLLAPDPERDAKLRALGYLE